jgi:hypothetical protein
VLSAPPESTRPAISNDGYYICAQTIFVCK